MRTGWLLKAGSCQKCRVQHSLCKVLLCCLPMAPTISHAAHTGLSRQPICTPLAWLLAPHACYLCLGYWHLFIFYSVLTALDRAVVSGASTVISIAAPCLLLSWRTKILSNRSHYVILCILIAIGPKLNSMFLLSPDCCRLQDNGNEADGVRSTKAIQEEATIHCRPFLSTLSENCSKLLELCAGCCMGFSGEGSRQIVLFWAVCIQAVCIFFIHPAVSSQRIIPMKQQVIFLVVVAFGHCKGYFLSLSFYKALFSCLGSEGQLYLFIFFIWLRCRQQGLWASLRLERDLKGQHLWEVRRSNMVSFSLRM